MSTLIDQRSHSAIVRRRQYYIENILTRCGPSDEVRLVQIAVLTAWNFTVQLTDLRIAQFVRRFMERGQSPGVSNVYVHVSLISDIS